MKIKEFINVHVYCFVVPYWIDYTDIGKEGKWVSLSTGKGIYHSRTFKPDNARGNQDCAFNNFGLRQGHWDDTYCTDKLNVICEAVRKYEQKTNCYSEKTGKQLISYSFRET